jgi:hypothetical protein
MVLVSIGTAALLLASSPPSAAHEHLQVGPYELTVGWREEPPLVGELNGLFLRVEYSTNGTPVEGAHQSLTAVLMTGSASLTATLRPQFGQPGVYTFDVIPTREGSYSVRITGSLGGTPVDVNVQLQEVTARSAIEFPLQEPTASELQAALDRVNAENTALRAQFGAVLAIAVAGAVIGTVGLAVGVFAWRRTDQKP